MKPGKYILGGGIAGLICAYFNPEYQIISDNIGGQMVDTDLGPRLLEANLNSATLLNKLYGYNHSIEIKTAKVGYYHDDHFILPTEMTFDIRKKYYMKSRCIDDPEIVPNSVMSDGKSEIQYYDINWNDLIDRLVKELKHQPIKKRVQMIDAKKHQLILHDSSEINFSHLISTIPAPLFLKVAGITIEPKLTYAQKLFLVVDAMQFDLRQFDYVYFVGYHLFHRATKLLNKEVAIEYTLPLYMDPTNFVEMWNLHTRVRRHKILKQGQIVSGIMPQYLVNNHGQVNIDFVGRLACWNHDIKTDDVIGQAINIRLRGDLNG